MRKTLLVLSVVLFSYHFICAQDLDPLLKRKLTNEQLEQLKLAEEKSNSQKSYHFLINSAADSKSYGNEPDWRWKSKIGGSGDDYCKGIATDSEGNMYFVGSFCGELSVGSETLKTTGDREAIITKFNNSGELLWIKQIEASTGEKTEAFDITVDQSNNIYVTGYYSGSIDVGAFNLPDQAEYNLYVIKLNTSGDYLMAVHYGDEGEYRIGLKMDIDNNGNIYIVGSTQTKTGWRHESIILKYDSNCTLLWEQLHDESINDIKVGETHAYFVGVVEGSYNDGFIDDNVTLNSSNYISNAFILKSDLSGDFKWGVTAAHVNLMESSYGERLDIDSEENIFMVGFFKEQVDFGGNILTDATTGYITKCDSSGNFQWAKKTTSNIEDVAVNNENEIVVLSQEITRFDNTGNTLWTKKTNLSTGSIYTDNSNNILAVGTENGMILIIKYNTSGVNSWHYQFEGNSARGDVIGMVADSIGNLYTYGYASNDIEFFGESINSGLFLSKQNYLGEVVWIKDFNDLRMVAGSFGN